MRSMIHCSRHLLILISIGICCFFPARSDAHCDSMDGPVVKEAQLALQSGDVTPVLKWVRPADEAEIRRVFDQVRKVRGAGGPARDLADTHFFETLVRIHREGEGAPYTGLKPAGGIDPGIAKADESLESGSVDELIEAISSHITDQIRHRFASARAAREHAGENVTAGRAYVESYVSFIHFVEELHQLATATEEAHEH